MSIFQAYPYPGPPAQNLQPYAPFSLPTHEFHTTHRIPPISNAYHYYGAYLGDNHDIKLNKIIEKAVNKMFKIQRALALEYLDYYYKQLKAYAATTTNQPMGQAASSADDTHREARDILDYTQNYYPTKFPFLSSTEVILPVPISPKFIAHKTIHNKLLFSGNHYYKLQNNEYNMDKDLSFVHDQFVIVRGEVIKAYTEFISNLKYLPTVEEQLKTIKKLQRMLKKNKN